MNYQTLNSDEKNRLVTTILDSIDEPMEFDDFQETSGESLFLSKDFPCSQRGNPQKYRDKLNCYASPSRPGHSFATQQGDGSHALQ